MSGIYKIGFQDGTPVAEAKEQALAVVRQTDDDEVTAGPEIVQSPDHEAAGTFLVRIVTGVQDPLRVPRAVEEIDPTSTIVGRVAQLPPEKIAALMRMLDEVER